MSDRVGGFIYGAFEMAKKIWKAKCACVMPWKDFRSGETCELDDKDVTERVRSLFVCMTEDEVKADEDMKRDAEDPTFKVKVQRLKQANVSIPRGANKKQIEELFNSFLQQSELPTPKDS